MNALFTAEALFPGQRPKGRASTPDETFNLTLTPQRELGGLGGGTNPEQPLAARFAACTSANLPSEQAQKLADATHLLCSYSNATRGNIDVIALKTND